MTDDKIREVIARYERVIADRPPHWPSPPAPVAQTLAHLQQMFPKMRAMLDESCSAYRPDHNGECLNCDEPYDAHQRDKVMRWLGFVQGVLWSLGVYTVADLRQHNAPGGEPW